MRILISIVIAVVFGYGSSALLARWLGDRPHASAARAFGVKASRWLGIVTALLIAAWAGSYMRNATDSSGWVAIAGLGWIVISPLAGCAACGLTRPFLHLAAYGYLSISGPGPGQASPPPQPAATTPPKTPPAAVKRRGLLYVALAFGAIGIYYLAANALMLKQVATHGRNMEALATLRIRIDEYKNKNGRPPESLALVGPVPALEIWACSKPGSGLHRHPRSAKVLLAGEPGAPDLNTRDAGAWAYDPSTGHVFIACLGYDRKFGRHPYNQY